MKTPKVSIVIPIYNVENHLRRCLDSLAAQTLSDIEVIMINDGSTDGSGKIAEEYVEKNKKFSLVVQKNSGISAARNAGLILVKAPFVMFVDGDDWVDPDYCEKLYNIINTGADVGVCGVDLAREANYVGEDNTYYFSIPRPINSIAAAVWNKIYRMSIITQNEIEFPVGLKHEDEYFWNVYYPWCNQVAFVQEKLYHYRQSNDSIMGEIYSKKPAIRTDNLKILAATGDYYMKHELMKDFGNNYWEFFDKMIRIARENTLKAPKKKKRLKIFNWLFRSPKNQSTLASK